MVCCDLGVYRLSSDIGCAHLALTSTLSTTSAVYPSTTLILLLLPCICSTRKMSHTSASSPSLQLLFDAALQSYEKQSGMKLIDHPLARQLENCHSVDSIMDILQQQVHVLIEFRGGNGKVMNSLKRVVHVLLGLSTNTILSGGISLVSRMVFLGILSSWCPFRSHSPLLTSFSRPSVSYSQSVFPNSQFPIPYRSDVPMYQAIKGVNAMYDALVDLLETIEHFLGRLEIYAGLSLTAAMGRIIVKIMVELLSTIALVTARIKQSRPRECVPAYDLLS